MNNRFITIYSSLYIQLHLRDQCCTVGGAVHRLLIRLKSIVIDLHPIQGIDIYSVISSQRNRTYTNTGLIGANLARTAEQTLILLYKTDHSLPFYSETLNPFASGIKKVFLHPIMGLFSVKIRKKNSSH